MVAAVRDVGQRSRARWAALVARAEGDPVARLGDPVYERLFRWSAFFRALDRHGLDVHLEVRRLDPIAHRRLSVELVRDGDVGGSSE